MGRTRIGCFLFGYYETNSIGCEDTSLAVILVPIILFLIHHVNDYATFVVNADAIWFTLSIVLTKVLGFSYGTKILSVNAKDERHVTSQYPLALLIPKLEHSLHRGDVNED